MIFLDGLLFRLILWHLFACLQADYFGGLVASNRTCGHSSSVEWKLPKLQRRVRFPLSAPLGKRWYINVCGLFLRLKNRLNVQMICKIL